MIIRINNKEPNIPFYMSDDVTLIGDVRVGENVSIWFKTVLRGDINYISIGDFSNVQDLSVGHVTEKLSLIIGNYVTVGHNVVMHGCNIGDYTLLGMGSIILDNAKIGKGCIIAAGTVVKENAIIPDYSLVAGVPGIIKKTFDKSIVEELKQHALDYLQYAKDMKLGTVVAKVANSTNIK